MKTKPKDQSLHEFGESLPASVKRAISIGLLFTVCICSAIGTNAVQRKNLDKQIAAAQSELDMLNNQHADFHKYSFEGKDSARLEADAAYLDAMFKEVFTFSDGDDFLTARDAALNKYHWNQNVVDVYFSTDGLYDAEGEPRDDINMTYASEVSDFYLVETLDDGRYYHYICDIATYVGNYQMSGTAGQHIIADVLMDKDQRVSIMCYNQNHA